MLIIAKIFFYIILYYSDSIKESLLMVMDDSLFFFLFKNKNYLIETTKNLNRSIVTRRNSNSKYFPPTRSIYTFYLRRQHVLFTSVPGAPQKDADPDPGYRASLKDADPDTHCMHN